MPHMVQDLVHVRVSELHKLQIKSLEIKYQVSSLEIKYQVWQVGRQRGRQGGIRVSSQGGRQAGRHKGREVDMQEVRD